MKYNARNVLANLTIVAPLASRIERAYRRHRPEWVPDDRSQHVWPTAAALLIQVHVRDSEVPIDPDLFVATLLKPTRCSDPWRELSHPAAAARYRRRIKERIAILTAELCCEVRAAELRLLRGAALPEVLLTEDPALTALGRYILAYRVGRPDLAKAFQAAAARQHGTLPLYRSASRLLLHPRLYPVALESDPLSNPDPQRQILSN